MGKGWLGCSSQCLIFWKALFFGKKRPDDYAPAQQKRNVSLCQASFLHGRLAGCGILLCFSPLLFQLLFGLAVLILISKICSKCTPHGKAYHFFTCVLSHQKKIVLWPQRPWPVSAPSSELAWHSCPVPVQLAVLHASPSLSSLQLRRNHRTIGCRHSPCSPKGHGVEHGN